MKLNTLKFTTTPYVTIDLNNALISIPIAYVPMELRAISDTVDLGRGYKLSISTPCRMGVSWPCITEETESARCEAQRDALNTRRHPGTSRRGHMLCAI
jgi:hypothetical protein